MEAHERLNEARRVLGKHQKDMAKALGVSQTSWSEYENGKTKLTKISYYLQEIFGISRQWLLNGTGPMFVDETPKPMNLNIYAGRDASGQSISVNETQSLGECKKECEILKVKLESLQAQLEQKDQQIADLRRMIDVLTNHKS